MHYAFRNTLIQTNFSAFGFVYARHVQLKLWTCLSPWYIAVLYTSFICKVTLFLCQTVMMCTWMVAWDMRGFTTSWSSPTSHLTPSKSAARWPALPVSLDYNDTLMFKCIFCQLCHCLRYRYVMVPMQVNVTDDTAVKHTTTHKHIDILTQTEPSWYCYQTHKNRQTYRRTDPNRTQLILLSNTQQHTNIQTYSPKQPTNI